MFSIKYIINKFRKNKENNKNTINPVVVEAAGIVAVAGIEIAMALKNKKTREKVKKTLMNIKDQAINYAETLKIETKKGGEKNGK